MENVKHMHKDVVITRKDGELVVTSRQVADDFEKEHSKVIRTIENLFQGIAKSGDTPSKYFIMDSYENEQNKQKYIQYLVTQRGFSLLVMGFTGAKALEWKLKYIEAFNKMEQAIKNPYAHLSKEVQAIFALDHKQQQLAVEVKELKEGMPLFNVECKEIQAAVKRKGVEILGGKNSVAYKNNSIRGKVYSDIQQQLRREFGVSRYEAIKRCQLPVAHEIVSKYTAPIYLVNEIYLLNQQLSDADYTV
ncbi:Rha family transcriptional regulator [uncultured Clostridium sp.]|uniref:Rha family transcriptional regulator n=1 Tax=uncultured Clostridium sp. TaxID=59620 RepID=UPI0025D16C7C|nr:Rha family transcriptional regulator [uncultured Clostridium sp.]MDU4882728.1 ORF6C domain-containing protein [Clostridium celatum]MDU7076002.1 ORF6C domain-containing protein [Clostridium celatum]